jgi:hypothetical protein
LYELKPGGTGLIFCQKFFAKILVAVGAKKLPR